jgi:Na+-driven multidrug efflux pump
VPLSAGSADCGDGPRQAAVPPPSRPAPRRPSRAAWSRALRPGAARSRAILRGPGAADREILRLAVPAFGALVAEPLFLLADSAIIGRIGTVPLGGLGVASLALTTLVNISIFLAYGTTAAVARQLGAGRVVRAAGGGLVGLWLAYSVWILARFVTLVARARGSRWLVTGAVRL